jgi:hypothetical protein
LRKSDRVDSKSASATSAHAGARTGKWREQRIKILWASGEPFVEAGDECGSGRFGDLDCRCLDEAIVEVLTAMAALNSASRFSSSSSVKYTTR